MLQFFDNGSRLCDGINRREWLRIGGFSLGGAAISALPAPRLRANSPRSFGKAKSVIMLMYLGGPPQHESWDPKPDAPEEIRGIFGTIPSATPGLRVGELMPLTANLTDRIAVLRAVTTRDNAHSASGYQMLTGVPHQPMNQENATPRAPNNWPSIGALVRYLRPAVGKLPSSIVLPDHIWNDGSIPWPGQDAGFLGHKHNPWLIHCDPSDANFRIEAMSLPKEVAVDRFNDRRTLLEQLDRHLDGLNHSIPIEMQQADQRKAFELLGTGASRAAFDLGQESPRTRDRYGRHRFGQSTLLARRLVENGVSMVQVNFTRVAGKPNNGTWDTHAKHSESIKDFLMPMMDQTYSALIDDLSARGLLDETLVVWYGEFGRTPKFNKNGGRDHWGSCFSIALAGGGIKGGVVHGTSDKSAAFPVDGRVEAPDLLATIFHCLGHAPDTEIRDTVGRPMPLCRGQVIDAIV